MKLTQLIPLLLSLAAAHAATLNVTTNTDTSAGSLRAQIAAVASGDTGPRWGRTSSAPAE